jgi:hypothetical protein
VTDPLEALTREDRLLLDAGLASVDVALRAFAETASNGQEDLAEQWAEFAFRLMDAFVPVDEPRGRGWTARLVFLMCPRPKRPPASWYRQLTTAPPCAVSEGLVLGPVPNLERRLKKPEQS